MKYHAIKVLALCAYLLGFIQCKTHSIVTIVTVIFAMGFIGWHCADIEYIYHKGLKEEQT